LVRTIKNKPYSDSVFTKVNLEDYKQISFPNSILQVLNEFLSQLKDEVNKSYRWYELKKGTQGRHLKKQLNSKITNYNHKIRVPDNYDENVKSTDAGKTTSNLKAPISGIEASVSKEISTAIERQKLLNVNKLNDVRNDITELKKLINDVAAFLNKHLFLVLDDFYFIKRIDQPYFIDFFHQLSKDTQLFLKIATIKHRSTLYIQGGGTFTGIEIGHDAQPIELDYTFDQFQALQNFMWDLLKQANRNSNANVDLDKLLTDNAFKQLCLASGGVPRDFLSLFIKLCGNMVKGVAISKPDVNEIAIENYPNKFESFRRDSAEEKDILEYYLQYLKDFMLITRKTNMFLVSNNDLANYVQIKQAIRELVDLRLIHVVDANTSSAPADGKRYSAYMIDIGLYPNSRTKITQIEPGVVDAEGRKDNIRSAPKINLEEFANHISNKNFTHLLQVTE
jgi:hypothetical protein